MNVLASWSGGKESCLACYKAILEGFEVSYLVSFVSEDGRVMGHGIGSELLGAQSKAVNIPIVQKRVSWETYEDGFRSVLYKLKYSGVKGAVFGDIAEIPGHEGWINRVCNEIGLKPIKPLWDCEPEQVLNDFINAGFEAFVVSVKADTLGSEWLERRINKGFVRDLRELKRTKKSEIDICGELGEYHTMVTNGPLFKRCLKIVDAERVLKSGCWILDVSRFEIVKK
jgi:uncharacterized protein (TIGR00290 family)